MRDRGFFFLAAVCGLTAAPASGAPVTFHQQIAPILYKNCSPCHRPGESAPFSILTYNDAKQHAAQIAAVTKRRVMPPWLPEPGYGHFQDERRLSDSEIELVQEWVKQGALPGNATGAARPPKFSDEWQLGTPDLILRASQPYQLSADGSEVFWNFILPVPITTTRWVRAIEVRPGNARVFHHANVIIDRSRSSRRQERTPGAGFPGMDLNVEEESFDPDGHFLSWKPGSEPVVEPEGMAWRADPGMDLVLNVHMRPNGKAETVSPMIGLYFTGQPQNKFPMLVQLEHDAAIDIPPGDKDFLLSDDVRLPLDVDVLEVYPHAHYLGKLIEGYATLPDGTKKWIIRIPEWDLSWQGVYRLKAPLRLPKGTVVSMRYHYDNSPDNVRNPSSPPLEVKGGNQATDEMGHLWLQVLPVGGGDQRAALKEGLMRQRLEKYPDDFTANYNMGDLMVERDPVGAIPFFEAATKANPGSVVAATELGLALFAAGKLEDAESQFRRAVGLDPSYADALYDLASVQAARGDWDDATAGFKRVLELRPDNAKARQHLGEGLYLWGDALAQANNPEQALLRYRESAAILQPGAEMRTKMALMLARLGRLPEAKTELESALQADPSFVPAKRLLADIEKRQPGK
jgi:Flp pilus assembly protein TadD